tara:strand:+ start:627 stop:734 length:108 start_codon:yes stop_codon:yes gene_type:complete
VVLKALKVLMETLAAQLLITLLIHQQQMRILVKET